MLLSFRALGYLYSVVLGALCVGEVTARVESSRRLSCLDDAYLLRWTAARAWFGEYGTRRVEKFGAQL